MIFTPAIKPKANAVIDTKLRHFIATAPFYDWLSNGDIFSDKTHYKDKYKNWLLGSDYSKITGLELFNNIDFTYGVTQCLDELLLRHKTQRLRTFKYEYHYTTKLHDNVELIENEDVITNDWVIVSLPFCFNGGYPDRLTQLLDDCLRKDVPVYIDAAFYTLSFDFELKLSHPAIKEVYFSLSKSHGLGFLRTGLRFSKGPITGPITMQNQYNYSNLAFIELGAYIIDQFDINYILDKYKNAYDDFCNQQNLTKTNCIHLAMTDAVLDDYLRLHNQTKLGLWWNE